MADNVRSGVGPRAPAPRTSTPPSTPAGSAGASADLAVARLSAGQRRRTALACLVARRPELWLLDEPHAGLDHEGRDLLDDLVHRAQAAGATIVLASHELDRAEALADRVVTIAGGTIAAPASSTPTTEEPVLVP